MRDSLLLCAKGEVPPNVAIVHLVMTARDGSDVESALRQSCRRVPAGTPEGQRLRCALALWMTMPDAYATITGVLKAVDHGGCTGYRESSIADWIVSFDRAAAESPEASVALYSLGDQNLLQQATTEVVQRMDGWHLLQPDVRALEIGCGIGRFAIALSVRVEAVIGIDISHRMLDAARRRSTDLGNVWFTQTSGCDLAAFADRSFDLVYAIDTFPYIVTLGKKATLRYFREVKRTLKPGGRFLVMNYSYRGDPEADRREIADAAWKTGFAVRVDGVCELALWDGMAFLLESCGEEPAPT